MENLIAESFQEEGGFEFASVAKLFAFAACRSQQLGKPAEHSGTALAIRQNFWSRCALKSSLKAELQLCVLSAGQIPGACLFFSDLLVGSVDSFNEFRRLTDTIAQEEQLRASDLTVTLHFDLRDFR